MNEVIQRLQGNSGKTFVEYSTNLRCCSYMHFHLDTYARPFLLSFQRSVFSLIRIIAKPFKLTRTEPTMEPTAGVFRVNMDNYP